MKSAGACPVLVVVRLLRRQHGRGSVILSLHGFFSRWRATILELLGKVWIRLDVVAYPWSIDCSAPDAGMRVLLHGMPPLLCPGRVERLVRFQVLVNSPVLDSFLVHFRPAHDDCWLEFSWDFDKSVNLRGQELVLRLHYPHNLLQGPAFDLVHLRDERTDGVPIARFGPAPAWELN